MNIDKKFYWLFPLLLFALLWQLGAWGVTESSEARYAEISREMLTSGNWLFPNLLGIYHFDKPPFVYWVTALGMKIFGANAFGVRFFLQIAFLTQIYLIYRIMMELFRDNQKALFSAVIYAGFPIAIFSIRALTIDSYLCTLELAAVFFMTRYYRDRSRISWLYLYFIFLGLAVFAKGPVGLIIPVLMIYPLRKITGVKGFRNGLHMALGALLSIIIGGWWFAYLMMKSPAFYNFLIGEQLVNRMMKANEMKRNEPFWYYLKYLPLTLVPSFFMLPQSIIQNIRNKATAINQLTLFGVLIPLLFFSASSSKLILYVLPIAPFIAMICGSFVDVASVKSIRVYIKISKILFIIIYIGLLALYFGFIPKLDFHPTVMLWVYWGFGVVMLFLISRLEKRHELAFLSLLFPLSLLPISTGVMSQNEIRINSTAPIARFIKEKKLDKGRRIIVWNYRLEALSFDLQKEIYCIKYGHLSLNRHTEFQGNDLWRKNLIDARNLQESAYLKALVHSPSVLVTKDDYPANLQWITRPYTHIKRFGQWRVYY